MCYFFSYFILFHFIFKIIQILFFNLPEIISIMLKSNFLLKVLKKVHNGHDFKCSVIIKATPNSWILIQSSIQIMVTVLRTFTSTGGLLANSITWQWHYSFTKCCQWTVSLWCHLKLHTGNNHTYYTVCYSRTIAIHGWQISDRD